MLLLNSACSWHTVSQIFRCSTTKIQTAIAMRDTNQNMFETHIPSPLPWPGGNKAPTYEPSKICNGLSDVPGHYNGGFGAPREFRVENFGRGGSAASEAVPTYARASPLLDEVEGAQSFGMNVFRLPFRIGWFARTRIFFCTQSILSN